MDSKTKERERQTGKGSGKNGIRMETKARSKPLSSLRAADWKETPPRIIVLSLQNGIMGIFSFLFHQLHTMNIITFIIRTKNNLSRKRKGRQASLWVFR